MLTPASVVAMGSSRTVTSLDHPPSLSCMCVSEKENFKLGISPLSVFGGTSMSGFSMSRSTSRGPSSVAPSRPRIGWGIRLPDSGRLDE
ncbi:hypothetical protein ABIE48_006622 [Paenibacillus sp. OAE614]